MLMDPDGLFRRFLLSVQKSQKNGRVTLTPPLSLGWLLLYILTSGRSGLSIGRRRLLNQQQVDTHEGKKGNLMDRLKDQTFQFRSLPSPLSLSHYLGGVFYSTNDVYIVCDDWVFPPSDSLLLFISRFLSTCHLPSLGTCPHQQLEPSLHAPLFSSSLQSIRHSISRFTSA